MTIPSSPQGVSDMYIVIDLLLFNSSISAIFKQTINHVGER
jgi:hypothetical protein